MIRVLRRYARKNDVPVSEIPSSGKGDHRRIVLGDRTSMLPGLGEIKPGTLHSILRRLGVREDLR